MNSAPYVCPSLEALGRDWRQVARLIDHTLLKPDATRAQLSQLCGEARQYGFYSVMVNPANIAHCCAELHGSAVVVGTVIGFPLGATTASGKLFEAAEALKLGAGELDMVMNVGALKSGEPQRVESEIRALAGLSHAAGARLKVILETALLSTDEKILACRLALTAGVDFVKTSTGFAASGATAADVDLMRRVVDSRCGVKAAGGIRSAATLLAMVAAGANRIGASASVAIVRELGACESDLLAPSH